MTIDSILPTAFENLGISKPVLRALNDVGYESPTPIQTQTIPIIIEGNDFIGQAQTGTGKTAAFALPLLTKIDLKIIKPQVLVLTPTRELAIQVSEAIRKYAKHLDGFHVMPIYGGQEYTRQLQKLKRGVHIVVGTPGRLMDHMRRKSMKLDALSCVVLDEADEMLRMGFIEDVEWILSQTPPERQIALFSATIPNAIRKIAQKYLKSPIEINVKQKTKTLLSTRQRYLMVTGRHKLDAITRLLEGEDFDGIIIFVRTRTNTVELTEKLDARSYSVEALNGDIKQSQRERTIERLKLGKIDILVATDVAARGLDVDRISHVINYDIPYDIETYIHRIGRTGRAGRTGEAVLFAAPREKRLLHMIEKATNQKIELMKLPTTEIINNKRIADFKQRISDTIATGELEEFYQLMEQYQQEHDASGLEIAAALAKMNQGDTPLLLSEKYEKQYCQESEKSPKKRQPATPKSMNLVPEKGKERFRIEVGKTHGVKPGNIVGAIAGETDIETSDIGRIDIYNHFSLIDLPKDASEKALNKLKKVRVSGKPMQLSIMSEDRPQKRKKAFKSGKQHRKGNFHPSKKRKKRVDRD